MNLRFIGGDGRIAKGLEDQYEPPPDRRDSEKRGGERGGVERKEGGTRKFGGMISEETTSHCSKDGEGQRHSKEVY